MRQKIVAILASLMLSCGSIALPNSPDEVGEGQRLVAGKVVTTYMEGSHRLFVYLESEGEIVVGVAKNADKEDVLKRLQSRLSDNKHLVVIFGDKVGSWEEYVEGIDVQIILVSYFDEKADRAMVVYTEYGDRVSDLLKQVNWGSVAGDIVKRAAKAAL